MYVGKYREVPLNIKFVFCRKKNMENCNFKYELLK